MTTIKFVEASGREVVTTVDRETTLMELAVAHNIEGVLAECGGACVCATCHCYLEDNHSEALGEPAPMESMMLDEVLNLKTVSYTHLTLPTKVLVCRSRWSPYH